MTIDEMRKRIKEIDLQIEKIHFSVNIRIRQLEAKRADIEQDIADRIHENELEVFEILKNIPESSLEDMKQAQKEINTELEKFL